MVILTSNLKRNYGELILHRFPGKRVALRSIKSRSFPSPCTRNSPRISPDIESEGVGDFLVSGTGDRVFRYWFDESRQRNEGGKHLDQPRDPVKPKNRNETLRN